ncbi:hypothetical protein E4U21_006774 [Claviceps maximensis]|nr:hypothetical protein E4U21_006774 [Claviceps maximensis]
MDPHARGSASAGVDVDVGVSVDVDATIPSMATANTPRPEPESQTPMPRLLTVALYHRDHLSRGKSRKLFGYEAFHWGLLVTPQISKGKDCLALDATDSSEIDPLTFRLKNPTMDWWINHSLVNPEVTSKMLGRIVIGEVPGEISDDEFLALCHGIPLPVKNTQPQQSCVSWAVSAVRVMQNLGWAWNFDVDQFKDSALAYADERLKEDKSMEPKVKYYKV